MSLSNEGRMKLLMSSDRITYTPPVTFFLNRDFTVAGLTSCVFILSCFCTFCRPNPTGSNFRRKLFPLLYIYTYIYVCIGKIE